MKLILFAMAAVISELPMANPCSQTVKNKQGEIIAAFVQTLEAPPPTAASWEKITLAAQKPTVTRNLPSADTIVLECDNKDDQDRLTKATLPEYDNSNWPHVKWQFTKKDDPTKTTCTIDAVIFMKAGRGAGGPYGMFNMPINTMTIEPADPCRNFPGIQDIYLNNKLSAPLVQAYRTLLEDKTGPIFDRLKGKNKMDPYRGTRLL